MAERNTVQGARYDEARDSDPFADLARIIGFDPRVKVQPSDASTPVAPSRQAAAPAPETTAPPGSRQPRTQVSPGAEQSWEHEFSDLDFGLNESAASSTPRDAAVKNNAGTPDEGAETAALPVAADHPYPVSTAADPAEATDVSFFELDAALEAATDSLDAEWAQTSHRADASIEMLETDSSDTGLEPLAYEADLAPVPAETLASQARAMPTDGYDPENLLDGDLLLDSDLDDVLAASIERDLGDTWLRSDDEAAAQPAPHRIDLSSLPAEEPSPDAATTEHPGEQDVGAPQAPPVMQEAFGAEPDFESELIAFLNDDGGEQAAAPGAATAAGSAGRDDASVSQASHAADLRSSASLSDGDDATPALEISRPAETILANGDPGAATSESRRPTSDTLPPSPASVLPSAPPDAAATDDDPFAALAAMAARYRTAQFAPAAKATPESVSQPAHAQKKQQIAEAEEMKHIPSARQETPEIETVDVPEHAVALIDDLDFPDLPYDQPEARQSRRAEVDAEFADLLEEMSTGEAARRQPVPAAIRHQHADARFEAREPPRAAYHEYERGPAPQAVREPASRLPVDPEDDWHPHSHAAQFSRADEDDPFYDDEGLNGIADDDMRDAAPKPRKRGRWLAALFGSVVIMGGAGALAMKFTGAAESAGPLLVKADANPIKIRPENPGGIVVPNQENQVYERVAGAASVTPAQEKLLSSAEEPVSLDEPAAEDELMPSLDVGDEVGGDEVGGDPLPAKSEERVAEDVQNEAVPQEPIAIAPRRVKTMVVRADGTLVERADATPAVETLVASAGDVIDAVRKGSAGIDTTASTASVNADAAVAEPVALSKPDAAPAKPVPAETAAVGGAWSMQIASQPNEEAARSSYADLAQRYAAVLAGRGVNIVKADVSGKGTFWRVRVPAETRSAAVDLCTNYKAAGGNCFVSK